MSLGGEFVPLSAYSGLVTTTSTNSTTVNLANYASGGSLNAAQNMMALNQYYYPHLVYQGAIGGLAAYTVEPVKAAKKKAKGLLAQLRQEIDGWHGDVLSRCVA